MGVNRNGNIWMADKNEDSKIRGFADSIDPVIVNKYGNESSTAAQKEIQGLILSIDDFWLKSKMLAVINETKLLTNLLKKQFSI